MSDRDSFLAWWGAPIGPNTKMTNGEAACGIKQACLDTWLAAIASERERHRLEVHSCGPACTLAVCVNARLRAEVESWAQQASDRTQDAIDLVAAERERCAKLAEEYATWGGSNFRDWFVKLAAAIRAKA